LHLNAGFNFWVSYPVVLHPSNAEHSRMAKPSPKHAGNPALVSIGKTVRAARKAQGFSQEELALATDMDRSYIGGIERGEHNLTILNLLRITIVLGISLGELLIKAGV
jgi:ribosome-binding protein aMBF1 (putative translation factor)